MLENIDEFRDLPKKRNIKLVSVFEKCETPDINVDV